MSGRQSAADGDPMELYQMFQSSYNKIAKYELQGDGYSGNCQPYLGPPPVSSAAGGILDNVGGIPASAAGRLAGKIEDRHWYNNGSAGEGALYGGDPSAAYYSHHQDWGLVAGYGGGYAADGGGVYGDNNYVSEYTRGAHSMDEAITVLRNHGDMVSFYFISRYLILLFRTRF